MYSVRTTAISESSCPKAAEYVQKGLCQKNADGLIVLPNGINPQETPGANLKERIDNWQKTQTAPQVSTNFVGAAEITTDYS